VRTPEKWSAGVPPFKATRVIGTDMDRSATYYFLLVIQNNHGSIS